MTVTELLQRLLQLLLTPLFCFNVLMLLVGCRLLLRLLKLSCQGHGGLLRRDRHGGCLKWVKKNRGDSVPAVEEDAGDGYVDSARPYSARWHCLLSGDVGRKPDTSARTSERK